METIEIKEEIDQVLTAAYSAGQKQAKTAVIVHDDQSDGTLPWLEIHHPGGNVSHVASPYHKLARREETMTVIDVYSFKLYWDAMTAEERGRVYVVGSLGNSCVTAVFDHFDLSDRADHVLRLNCTKTPEWSKLVALHDRQMGQDSFVDFLDNWSYLFVQPDAASLRDIILNLEGANNVTWASKYNPTTGGMQLSYSDDAATSGGSGKVTFPTKGTVQLRVYEGGPVETVLVHFRYRVSKDSGALSVGFFVPGIQKVERDAFRNICQQVTDAVDAQVSLTG